MTREQQTLPDTSDPPGSGETARLERFELFALLTFLGTWLLWVPVAALNASEGAGTIPVVLGAFAPSIVGLMLTRRYADPDGRRDFWRRVRDPGQIGMRWGLVTILFVPTLMALTLGLSALVGMDLPPKDNALDTLTDPLALVGFVVLMAIGGPIAEELGWRGFALDAAQDRWTPITASLSIGAIWALWHAPLFFIDFTTQGSMGPWSAAAALWAIQVVLVSFIYTSIYNNTGRSILAALILHFMWNSVDTIIVGVGDEALSAEISAIKAAILAAVVGVLIAFGRSGTALGHPPLPAVAGGR